MKCLRLLLLFLFLLPGMTSAVTLKQIIQGYINAQGGEEAIDAVQSLRLEGIIMQNGARLPFIQIKKVPNLMRTTVELPQGEFITGYDGSVAWMKSRAMKHSLAMEGEAASATATSAPLFSQLYLMRQLPERMKLLGTADINGITCYEIQVRPESGQSTTYFISADTYMEKKVEILGEHDGKLSRTEIYYSDERLVAPLTIPFSITTYQNGELTNTITIDKASINTGIFSDYFLPPGGIMAKEAMVAEAKEARDNPPETRAEVAPKEDKTRILKGEAVEFLPDDATTE